MPEPQDVDLWALSDLATPWCMHVVATLRIADYLAAGTTAIDDLARASGADADSLARALRHLVGKGVFTEPTPGQFALNAAADMLRDGHPSRLRFGLDLNGIGNRMAYAWGTLLMAVQTGKPAYADLFGRPFWDDLDAHPEIAASFDALMGPAGHGTPDPDVLLADDWDSVRSVVDVGGGTGTLLAEILRTRPGLHGTLVDRPETVARSGETFQAAGVADRVTTVGQSFFDELPPGADLYLLKNVLGDWPDDEAVRLLRRCADAARPTGRVVILGGVTPEGEGTAPSPALLMMVLVGGRERRLAEFTELARPAGLEVTAAARQAAGRFVVECRPV
jgi:2,7-dihydroxy-5-methyl-1-naphthoate 7-O-methyltransferase